jgi:hypothetical protein
MRWAVVETGSSVHVVPQSNDGLSRFGHELAADCHCVPVSESHVVPLVIHNSWPKRMTLRVWNLRRELKRRRR